VQSQLHPAKRLPERAGYFEVCGSYLYTVLHEVEDPDARVLLVGPFASERHFSYHPWVRWARYLAQRRIEVLRFDYRGIGESTGSLDKMTFEDWSGDVRLLSGWLQGRTPKVPLLLHGLEIGAILANRVFRAGVGDALLLWSAPANANEALRSSLRCWAGREQLYESSENRRTASEYIQQLEQGNSIEVAGYQWSSRLWLDSFNFVLGSSIGDRSPTSERPVQSVKLGKEAAPLIKLHVGINEVTDLSWLYGENFAWLTNALRIQAGAAS
jgi:hypothetical protein